MPKRSSTKTPEKSKTPAKNTTSQKKLTNKQGDALPLTAQTLRQMVPLTDADPAFMQRLAQAKRGRPAGRTKAVVSISLDHDVLNALKQGGSGWQSRVNALLRAAVGLHTSDNLPH